MLTKLYIKNFAIIAEVELHFQSGLIALTGETGAGKSIILGAINLILGARADTNLLYDTNEKCVIEAVFAIAQNKDALLFLKNNDIDETTTDCIIRREIAANGRSRAFINDTPVTLTQLNDFGEMLIDLHRQFDTLQLKNNAFQLDVLDAVANHDDLLNIYKNNFTAYKNTQAELNKLKENSSTLQQEYDFNKFLLDELEKINLQPNAIEEAEEQLHLLSNAEGVKASLQASIYDLSDSETPIVSVLKNCINQLQNQSKNVKKIQPILDRLQSTYIELKDIVADLENLQESIVLDNDLLQTYTDKYNEGTRLLNKHHVQSTAQLIEIKAILQNKILQTTNVDEQLTSLKIKQTEQLNTLQLQAKTITTHRQKASAIVSQQVNSLLPKMGMPAANLKIEISVSDINAMGMDKVEFLFDANNTNKYSPINKVASGGELSRLILAIKSLMATTKHLPTLVFDEIDAGISGEAAKQVGLLMKNLANQHQILTVTHLPQIAAMAQHHLYVYKQKNDTNDSINTQVKLLTEPDRIQHLAEMLGGKSPTASVLQLAKEMIG